MPPFDFIVLGVYVCGVIAAGLLFKDRLQGAKEYFAAGGNMLWWLAGFSAITSELSVFGFTGLAGRYSTEGLLLLYANLASYATLPLLYWLGPRFRRLRVTTAIEAIGLRFGMHTETFYSFITIPLGIWMGAMGLHVTAIFFSAATGVDADLVVCVVGGLITVMSALGGVWAVSTSDLFQGALTLFMMIVLLLLAVTHPRVEAAGGLWQSLPKELINPTEQMSLWTIVTWIFSMTILTLMGRLSVMHDGWKFIVARSEQDCRRMVTVFLVLGLCMTPLIALPSVLSIVILGPEGLAAATRGSEGVIAHLARAIMPAGLMGLMLAAIVAAAMNSMDQGLNRNVGVFITSIYQRFYRAEMTDLAIVRFSRLTTLVFGGCSILIAFALNSNRQSPLFDFVLRMNSLLVVPLTIPLAMGLMFPRAPGWTGWVGALFCSTVAWIADTFIDGGTLIRFLNFDAVSVRDAINMKTSALVLSPILGGALFFAGAVFCRRFAKHTGDPLVGEVFWQRWNAPLASNGSEESARLQRRNTGWLLTGFGLALGALIPFLDFRRETPWVLAFASCILTPGLLLLRIAGVDKDDA